MANHVWLPAHGTAKNFRTKLEYIPPPVPLRTNPLEHARFIRQGLRAAFDVADARVPQTRAAATVEPWSYLEISTPDETFSPDRYGKGSIEVLAVRKTSERDVSAVLYVPKSSRPEYFRRLDEYRKYPTKKTESGKPRYHDLIDSIDGISNATARALWTGESPFPTESGEHWWELWLVVPRAEEVRAAAKEIGLHLSAPMTVLDRAIHVVKATVEQMEALVSNGHGIAELRPSVEPRFVARSASEAEQQVLMDDLMSRIHINRDSSLLVSVLDTGVNAAHPLLAPVLDAAHHLAIDNLSPLDQRDHGTAVAGLAIYGDLAEIISAAAPVDIAHRLESVNIDVLAPVGSTLEEARHFFANKVLQAIAHAERLDPNAIRVFCLAMTMNRSSTGVPTSWSVAIDQAAVSPDQQRLVIVSAGNVLDGNGAVISSLPQTRYPLENQAFGVHDPAQAWNALSVGGYTNLTTFSPNGAHAGYQPRAQRGDLSPYTSTSAFWNKATPIKPDIVLEAGNMACFGSADAVFSEDLEMLAPMSTGAGMRTFAQTSGAAALASRLAAQVWSRYPHLKPETIRALIVHASSWTSAMEARHGTNQRTRAEGLRHYGYGVPNSNRAIESGDDSATIVIESQIQPYAKSASGIVGAKMVIHDLPWPTEVLEAVHDALVELRVTLSYFIEPLPGARGFRGKYPYQSHGLRFHVQRATEKRQQFIARVSKIQDDEPAETVAGQDLWTFGVARNKGCVQSDFTVEPARNIAKRSCVIVYPNGTGWWKNDQDQERYNSVARYSLIVSLRPVAESRIEGLYAAIEGSTVSQDVTTEAIEIEHDSEQ